MNIYILILLVFLLRLLNLLCVKFFPIMNYKPTWERISDLIVESAGTLGFLAMAIYYVGISQ